MVLCVWQTVQKINKHTHTLQTESDNPKTRKKKVDCSTVFKTVSKTDKQEQKNKSKKQQTNQQSKLVWSTVLKTLNNNRQHRKIQQTTDPNQTTHKRSAGKKQENSQHIYKHTV